MIPSHGQTTLTISLVIKVKQGVGIIKKTSKYLDKNYLLVLYRTFVETQFRYCNVIWGQCNETLLDKLQLLQNRAARVITKVKYDDADHLANWKSRKSGIHGKIGISGKSGIHGKNDFKTLVSFHKTLHLRPDF